MWRLTSEVADAMLAIGHIISFDNLDLKYSRTSFYRMIWPKMCVLLMLEGCKIPLPRPTGHVTA